jgi:tRNA-dihydrouridine synthase B
MQGMNALPGKLFLAPMAEISTPALRSVIKELYPGTVLYSEMLSAGAIVAGGEHNEPLVKKYDFDDPLVYQIVGADPAVMAGACEILSGYGCFAMDINMGCPIHDIVKKGQGSRLLTDTARAREIVRACRKTARTGLSVKMRTGWEENDGAKFVEFIKMLEGEGVDFIAVHPRYARLGFRRTAEWKLVELAKRSVSIPVIGNGDIDSPEACARRIRETGCDGVMIGREAVKSPWIFRLAAVPLEGAPALTGVNVRDIFMKVLDNMKTYLPERLHRSRSHRFCAYYSQNARYGHELFTRIRKESSIDRILELVDDYYLRNPDEAGKRFIPDAPPSPPGGAITNALSSRAIT